MGAAAKKSFLVVYDYGTGGVWAIMNARSEDEIIAKFPKLKVIDERPPWMDQKEYDSIASRDTFDVDDEPTGWLAGMRTHD